MSDLIQLSDDEIATVAGGGFVAFQLNNSEVNQLAVAKNFGIVVGVGSKGGTGAAAGAEAGNTAVVFQNNSI